VSAAPIGREKTKTQAPIETEEPTQQEGPSATVEMERETPQDLGDLCETRLAVVETRYRAAEIWALQGSPVTAAIVPIPSVREASRFRV
jgi:hypothetical protein